MITTNNNSPVGKNNVDSEQPDVSTDLSNKESYNSDFNKENVQHPDYFHNTDDMDSPYSSSPITPETDHLDFDLHNLECVTQQKRVKVYLLENNEWQDVGTGYCTGEKKQSSLIFDDSEADINTTTTTTTTITIDNNNDKAHDIKATERKKEETEPFLLVRDEKVPDSIILISKLEGNIEYQRQEDTLIVWKDLNGRDVALSFEESNGCDHICEFIVNVQLNVAKHISLVAIKSDMLTNTTTHEIIAGPVNLPSLSLDLSILEMIESLKIFNENLTYQFLKVETLNFIIEHNYFECLIENFTKAELQKNWKKLLLLSSILKTIILFNEQIVLDYILKNEYFNGILGILEYDSEFPIMKANYRETFQEINSQQILKNKIWFNPKKPKHEDSIETTTSCNITENQKQKNKEELENTNEEEEFEDDNDEDECRLVVNQLCKLTFLRDVVLVRYLEDYPIITDCIQEDQTFIIDFMTNRSTILDQIIDSFLNSDDKTEKLDSLKLLHESVLMAKTSLVDHSEKAEFFAKLVNAGLFKMLQNAFNTMSTNNQIDESIKGMATDLIVVIIEHDVLLINSNASVASAAAAAVAAATATTRPDLSEKILGSGDLSEDIVTRSMDASKSHSHDLYADDASLHDMSLLMIISKLLVYGDNHCLKDQLLQTLLTLLHPDGNNGSEEFMTNNYGHFDIQIEQSLDVNGIPIINSEPLDVDMIDYEPFDKENGFDNAEEKPFDNDEYHSDQDSSVLDDDDESSFDSQVIKFLRKFYASVAPVLFKPLISFPEEKTSSYLYLVKLIKFIAIIHNRKISREFILSNNILQNVSKLVIYPSSSLQLKLAAIRCLKCIISLNDEKYINYFISNNILFSVFELLKENKFKDNLCTSTVLDLIKNIIDLKQDTKSLISKRNYNALRDYFLVNFSNNLENLQNEKLIQNFLLLKKSDISKNVLEKVDHHKTNSQNMEFINDPFALHDHKRSREETPEIILPSETSDLNLEHKINHYNETFAVNSFEDNQLQRNTETGQDDSSNKNENSLLMM